MQKQIIDYINQYLFPLLCGYIKGFSTKSLKEALDICSPFLWDIRVDEIVYKGTFPKDFKNANPAPAFFFKRQPSFS